MLTTLLSGPAFAPPGPPGGDSQVALAALGRRQANRSTPIIVQQTPRNFARSDTPTLALNDGGHGSAALNAILYGLGGTLQFQFNPFVRTFRVYVEDTIDGPVTRQEITSSLLPVANVAGRYRLHGAVGEFPLGLAGRVASDYDTPQVIRFVIDMTNASITRQAVYTTTISNAGQIQHCAPAEDCDFDAMRPINKARIRIFENVVDADDPNNATVSFLFEQLDLLVTKTAAVAVGGETAVGAYPGYSAAGTVGVEFSAGDAENCGPQGSPGQPGCESIDCCCTMDTVSTEYPAAFNTVSPGGTTTIGTTLTITARIPLLGSQGCLGWPELQITFPGADTTAGVYGFDDTYQPMVQQLCGVGPIAITPVSGLGHNGSRTATLSAPVVCCGTLDIRWQMVALIPTTGLHSVGTLEFFDIGICNPVNNPLHALAFSVLNGGTMDPPGKPPPPTPPSNEGIPMDITGQDPTPPTNVMFLPSYEVMP